ncbi:MAG: calcium-binding protein [Nostoc sp.]
MANIIGTNRAETIKGQAGSDTITANQDDDTLTGGGGKDTFVYKLGDGTDIITDFGGVGKGTNPTAAVLAEVDTIKFEGYPFTAQNLLLTQNGSNLEITFEGAASTKVILQNFKLENLENLKASGARLAIGNILFNGQTSITDSFDVFDANSTQTSLSNKNTVTFLNDLDNNITGLDNSDDVVNGQGGNDRIDGKSGNDLLRGGAGNDTLNGGTGNDSLDGGTGNDWLRGDAGNNTLNGGIGDDDLNIDSSTGDNLLSGGDGNDSLFAYYSSGNNTLKGGAGDDYLFFNESTGNNLLSGGDGNDSLFAFTSTSGNNTLKGGAGDDELNIGTSTGDNLLFGDDGNDSILAYGEYRQGTSGNNTLKGGAGDDYLSANFSAGNNLLDGDDDNDSLFVNFAGGNNTLKGGAGDDTLSADFSRGDNLLSGGDGNDYFSLSVYSNDYYSLSAFGNNTLNGGNGNDFFSLRSISTTPSDFVTQTVDGGIGDDLLLSDNYYATEGITSTFNTTTNIGSITAGMNRVNYKNIERLNISGTAYDDNIVGSSGNDTLNGGSSGNDTIDGGTGDDYLSVDFRDASRGITSTFNATTNIGSITAGTNRIKYKNIERLNISGTAYDDNIVGSSGNDTLYGGSSGNDTIDGGIGDDLLLSDNYYATEGITSTFNATTNIGSITVGTNQVKYKNIERLLISGTAYDDNIVGSNGNDTLYGGSGGNDTIAGGAGNDSLSAFNAYGNNTLKGGAGDDTLNANDSSGNNLLSGGDGNDILTGGNGNDSLYGGSGSDTFAFNSFNEGVDNLYDFDATNELIQVSAAGFGGGLSIGSLKTSQFTIGTSATTSTQRFIYNSATGGLFFDLDGSISGFTQVKFAQLSTGLSLSEDNFVIV